MKKKKGLPDGGDIEIEESGDCVNSYPVSPFLDRVTMWL